MSRLNDLLLLTYVPRWSIIPVARPESVAEHSFRVAVIALEIAQRANLETAPVLYRALIHDGPEAGTGDIANPVKGPIAPDLQRIERVLCPWWDSGRPSRDIFDHIVKVADVMDALVYLQRHGEFMGGLNNIMHWALERMETQYESALNRLPEDMQKTARIVYSDIRHPESPWQRLDAEIRL